MASLAARVDSSARVCSSACLKLPVSIAAAAARTSTRHLTVCLWLQTARLLLALALVAAAKVSLADRVVPEGTFYDHAIEQECANEEDSNDAARSTRAQTRNANSGSICDLLNSLIDIGNEQTACNTQYGADSKVCLDSHKPIPTAG